MSRASTYSVTERKNLNGFVNYDDVQSLPEMWAIAAQRFGTITAVYDPHSEPQVVLTYAALYQQMQQFAAGLQALGVQAGDRVGLFSDNSPRWLIADQGIMLAGAIDVVRSSQAERQELRFILDHSGTTLLVVENNATLKKLLADLEDLPISSVILLSDETPPAIANVPILNLPQLMERGASHPLQPAHPSRDSLATLMYTSGTSGMPKGVMLSHHNLLSQVTAADRVVQPQAGERVLSILPVWHCYERTFEYFVFSKGCTQAYTTIRHIKKDMKEFKPHYMVAVPRLFESIYEGVQKQFREQPANKQRLIHFFLNLSQRYIKARRIVQGLDLENLNPSVLQRLWAGLQQIVLWGLHKLGDRLVYRQVRAATGGHVKFFVSGGGSIADHLEDFFELIGVNILGGYGLTETSPITHVRRPNRNIRGADGQPLVNTEARIVDLETRQPLLPGKQGLVLLRGPQIMQGYYNNPEATQTAIDPEGWFNSGDLGWVTRQDDLIITGRAKDTIVLTNGENIEPQPIEDVCLRSPYIDQIMLVGQDQKVLGALIVPNLDALQQWATTQNYVLEIPQRSGRKATQQGKQAHKDTTTQRIPNLQSKI